MRTSLKEKIIRVCNQKISSQGESVKLSFYAFFSNKNEDSEILMEAARWWIKEKKLDHFEKATKIKKLVEIPCEEKTLMTNCVGELIKNYRGEVDVAVSSFYAWEELNHIPNDGLVDNALDRDADFWKIASYSLLTTFFIALGRIFDSDKRSLTIDNFIKNCGEQSSQFSRPALETRKINQNSGTKPGWLNDLLLNMYEPTKSDFDNLSKEVKKYKAIYQKRYQSIRHRVMAHRDLKTINSANTLFEQTNIAEIKEMLLLLEQIGEVIQEWYLNGRNTNLTGHSLCKESDVAVALRRILNTLSRAQQTRNEGFAEKLLFSEQQNTKKNSSHRCEPSHLLSIIGADCRT